MEYIEDDYITDKMRKKELVMLSMDTNTWNIELAKELAEITERINKYQKTK